MAMREDDERGGGGATAVNQGVSTDPEDLRRARKAQKKNRTFLGKKKLRKQLNRLELETLMEQLKNPGTDPRLLNRQLADIDLGGQRSADLAQGRIAAGGLTGSNFATALQSAIDRSAESARGRRLGQEGEFARRNQMNILQQIGDVLGRRAGNRNQKRALRNQEAAIRAGSGFGTGDFLNTAAGVASLFAGEDGFNFGNRDKTTTGGGGGSPAGGVPSGGGNFII